MGQVDCKCFLVSPYNNLHITTMCLLQQAYFYSGTLHSCTYLSNHVPTLAIMYLLWQSSSYSGNHVPTLAIIQLLWQSCTYSGNHPTTLAIIYSGNNLLWQYSWQSYICSALMYILKQSWTYSGNHLPILTIIYVPTLVIIYLLWQLFTYSGNLPPNCKTYLF